MSADARVSWEQLRDARAVAKRAHKFVLDGETTIWHPTAKYEARGFKKIFRIVQSIARQGVETCFL